MTATMTTALTLADRFAAEFPNSRRLADRARTVFPDGVTHDNRHLEPFPIYVERAAGAHKWDVDGHRLIDYWAGHGALLLGHSHPAVVAAVSEQAGRSTHPGACHEREVEWGQLVQQLIPSAERVRFVSSGTEATLMALRLARLYSGRPKVLKFVGHFHGWHDSLIPAAYAPHDSVVPGIPIEMTASTVIVPPNDPALVEKTLANDDGIGCVIVEPTGGHWGQVPIGRPFLEALRDITAHLDRVLIFDEVITGFRVSPGGAQALYGITPDMTTLAKILAGGLPGGAVVGRADIMAGLEHQRGAQKIKHPGTFNANPLSAAAGVAALKVVATGAPQQRANATAKRLRRLLNEMFAQRGYDWICYGDFSGWRLVPGYRGPRPDADDFVPYNGELAQLDAPRNARLHHSFRQAMLLYGVDVWGLSGMTSSAHSEADIDQTVMAIENSVAMLRMEGVI